MKLIDTHCHLYLKDFDDDRHEMMSRARVAGVSRFYLPCIDSNIIGDMLQMEEDYKGECFAMMGLHPCSVNAAYKEELAIVKSWLDKRKFVAIGEVGLDFYWDTSFTNEQYEAFNLQMEWALEYDLPLVVHTRSAMQQTIDAVRPFSKRGLTGIFHCFGDSRESAKQITDMGFLLGIGGVLTYKNAGVPAMLQDIDTKHLVLETDAPYLAPVPFRGKRNESSYLLLVAEKLAEVKNLTLEELALITSANVEKLFNH